MRMPPPAMIRTAATAQGAPGIWPWRSDAPDWPARDPHISLATRTRIWMSPCHPPLCRHPLTWPQGAQRVTKLKTNHSIPSCIYILYMMRAIGCIYLSYNYRICISHKQWSCLCLSPCFFWALSLCVCAAPPPRAPPTRVCSTYIWKIILFLIFVISFLWVSFSLFFMSFHCVLRPTFFTFRSRLCCTLHTLIQVIWLYKFWFRFEFLIHYYFKLGFIFVSR